MSSTENLSPQVMAALARQIRTIMTKPPDGVKYVPTDGNLTELLAEIEGPERTPYEGGVFKVKLVLGKDYPSKPPRGFFLTKIFHPNVAPSGDICVNTLKRDWKPDLGLAHVLQVIRCLLIVPFPESSLNDDAGKLFMESYDDYARHARLMTSIHAMPATPSTTPLGAAAPSTAATAAAAPASAAPASASVTPTAAATPSSAAGAGVSAGAAAAAPGDASAGAAGADDTGAAKKRGVDKKKDKDRKRKAESKKKNLKRL